MMSGSILAPWASQPRPRDNARALARSLGCLTDDSRSVLKCLQVRTNWFSPPSKLLRLASLNSRHKTGSEKQKKT